MEVPHEVFDPFFEAPSDPVDRSRQVTLTEQNRRATARMVKHAAGEGKPRSFNNGARKGKVPTKQSRRTVETGSVAPAVLDGYTADVEYPPQVSDETVGDDVGYYVERQTILDTVVGVDPARGIHSGGLAPPEEHGHWRPQDLTSVLPMLHTNNRRHHDDHKPPRTTRAHNVVAPSTMSWFRDKQTVKLAETYALSSLNPAAEQLPLGTAPSSRAAGAHLGAIDLPPATPGGDPLTHYVRPALPASLQGEASAAAAMHPTEWSGGLRGNADTSLQRQRRRGDEAKGVIDSALYEQIVAECYPGAIKPLQPKLATHSASVSAAARLQHGRRDGEKLLLTASTLRGESQVPKFPSPPSGAKNASDPRRSGGQPLQLLGDNDTASTTAGVAPDAWSVNQGTFDGADTVGPGNMPGADGGCGRCQGEAAALTAIFQQKLKTQHDHFASLMRSGGRGSAYVDGLEVELTEITRQLRAAERSLQEVAEEHAALRDVHTSTLEELIVCRQRTQTLEPALAELKQLKLRRQTAKPVSVQTQLLMFTIEQQELQASVAMSLAPGRAAALGEASARAASFLAASSTRLPMPPPAAVVVHEIVVPEVAPPVRTESVALQVDVEELMDLFPSTSDDEDFYPDDDDGGLDVESKRNSIEKKASIISVLSTGSAEPAEVSFAIEAVEQPVAQQSAQGSAADMATSTTALPSARNSLGRMSQVVSAVTDASRRRSTVMSSAKMSFKRGIRSSSSFSGVVQPPPTGTIGFLAIGGFEDPGTIGKWVIQLTAGASHLVSAVYFDATVVIIAFASPQMAIDFGLEHLNATYAMAIDVLAVDKSFVVGPFPCYDPSYVRGMLNLLSFGGKGELMLPAQVYRRFIVALSDVLLSLRFEVTFHVTIGATDILSLHPEDLRIKTRPVGLAISPWDNDDTRRAKAGAKSTLGVSPPTKELEEPAEGKTVASAAGYSAVGNISSVATAARRAVHKRKPLPDSCVVTPFAMPVNNMLMQGGALRGGSGAFAAPAGNLDEMLLSVAGATSRTTLILTPLKHRSLFDNGTKFEAAKRPCRIVTEGSVRGVDPGSTTAVTVTADNDDFDVDADGEDNGAEMYALSEVREVAVQVAAETMNAMTGLDDPSVKHRLTQTNIKHLRDVAVGSGATQIKARGVDIAFDLAHIYDDDDDDPLKELRKPGAGAGAKMRTAEPSIPAALKQTMLVAERLTCVCCKDFLTVPRVFIPCGHVFCKACVDNHMKVVPADKFDTVIEYTCKICSQASFDEPVDCAPLDAAIEELRRRGFFLAL
jgi:hypothetical protein